MRQSSGFLGGVLGRLDRSSIALMASTFIVIASVTLVVRIGGEGTVAATVVLVLLALLLTFVLIRFGRMLAGVDPEANEIARHLGRDHDQRLLLERWLRRARWARNVGGLSGLVFWIFGTSMQGDLLAFGVGGIALGAIGAELHHVAPVGGPRTARLEPRSLDEYLMRQDRNRMLYVGLGALGVTAAGLTLGDTRSPAWLGIAALAVLGAARMVQHRVASRPRPAIADRLRQADDFARELAVGRGLARPATFFALALIARACFLLGSPTNGGTTIVGIAAWVYATWLWWNNRRLGLDFVLERGEPVLA